MLSRLIICLFGFLFFCNEAQAAERTPCQLAAPFTSNMILQRDVEVPIWGYAEPDAKITVEFAGQSKTVQADKRGDWIVRLNALQASKTGRHQSRCHWFANSAERLQRVVLLRHESESLKLVGDDIDRPG